MDNDLVTVADLQERWRIKWPDTIYRMAKKYRQTLQPIKIGRTMLFNEENIKKFEQERRVIST